MQQQTGALQMAQEQMPQTGTFRGTFNQARHIGHHKALLWAHADNTQVGVQSGEGVIGDFGAGVGNSRNESGFARIGHAEQTHVSQHLQFELELFLFTEPARCFLAWGTVDGAFETHVAKATVTALGDHDGFARHQQFIQHFACFGIGDDGAHRHFQGDIVTGSTKHVRAHAVLATLGIMAARIAVIDQGVQVDVGKGKHMPATTTVATVGAAEFFVLFMAERDAAVPAVTCGDVNIGFVNELHEISSVAWARRQNSSGPKCEKPRLAGLLFAMGETGLNSRSHVHHVLAELTFGGKRHVAVNQGKQSVVFADTDIVASMELGTTLTNDDRASADQFTTESLDTQHLWLGITTVARRAAAFFLCHDLFSSGRDRADLQFCELLAVTLTFLIVLTTAHLEDVHFVVLAMCQNCGFDCGAGHQGRADLEFSAGTDGQNLINHDFLANVRSNLFYFNFFASDNTILFAAGFYDRVHK